MARSSSPQPLDLERLPRLSADELRELWRQHMDRAKMPAQKRLLIRELAWRIQERQHGGLDAATQRFLSAAVRAASSADAADSNAEPADSVLAEQPLVPTRRPCGSVSKTLTKPSELPNATRLTRTWRGVVHEVHILDGGRSFRYRDKDYKSLSEIAREITGTHWSGPRFFGMTARSIDNDSIKPTARAKRSRRGEGKS